MPARSLQSKAREKHDIKTADWQMISVQKAQRNRKGILTIAVG
jgi:hypothetical protein